MTQASLFSKEHNIASSAFCFWAAVMAFCAILFLIASSSALLDLRETFENNNKKNKVKTRNQETEIEMLFRFEICTTKRTKKKKKKKNLVRRYVIRNL